jgi:hypothetical protein
LAPGWKTTSMLGGAAASCGGLFGNVTIIATISATCSAAETAAAQASRLLASATRRRGTSGMRRPCVRPMVGIRRGLVMLSDAGFRNQGTA